MYKQLTSARDTHGLSFDFDRNRWRRQLELTHNKTQKSKFHLRIMLKVVFSFFQCQEKMVFGLTYKFTLTRNTDNAVLNKDKAIKNAKKIMLWSGMYRILKPVFQIKLYYLSQF